MATGKFSLLSSGQQFLVESLHNLRDGKVHLAIMHAVTAVELVLKERLVRLNPALIYQNIDSKTPSKERTVSLGNLPRRLGNLGIGLDPEQAQLVREIAGWRHEIVHHMPSFDMQLARQRLPMLLDFLATFLRKELDAPLESFLPRRLFRDAQGMLADWRDAVAAARAKAKAEGRVISRRSCSLCGGVEVMCQRGDDQAHCHLCGADLYILDHCDGCGRETVTSYDPYLGENYCDECVEAADEAWIDLQIDRVRGK